jgi:pimeloyl-ACP methyl ester carboxylesterase
MARSTPPEAEIPVSDELVAPVSSEIELCYQTFGDPADDTVLLVMGLGGPMTWWHPDFCRKLAATGRYVVRFDNRDSGRSSRVRERVGHAQLMRAFAGRPVRTPYTLADMADDAFGLLDHLGVERADVVGISMGGMIAQTMAIAQPARVRSLTSIMSTTGKRSVGWQHPRLLPMLVARRGPDRETYAQRSARLWDLIGSPAFPQPREETLARARETFDRGVSASGVMRQMLAILHESNRGPRLRGLSMPALVVHGTADRMVHVSGGRATARALPGSELLLIDGMGHDLPPDLFDTVVEAIDRTSRRAGASGS